MVRTTRRKFPIQEHACDRAGKWRPFFYEGCFDDRLKEKYIRVVGMLLEYRLAAIYFLALLFEKVSEYYL
jgi:hypothetical protein